MNAIVTFFQALAAYASRQIDPFTVGDYAFQLDFYQARQWYSAWEDAHGSQEVAWQELQAVPSYFERYSASVE